MRIAVFTNRFPSRISTFFARDMRALINAGLDIDIFAFYPLEPELWCYVPDLLNAAALPRTKIHHISITESLQCAVSLNGTLQTIFREIPGILCSAAKFGPRRFVKTVYVLLKALAWSRLYNGVHYDQILAYWGNYAATCAYVFHRLSDQSIPFSMFLHAGMDLYEGHVYMKEKLLYSDNLIVVCDFNRQFLREQYTEIFPLISPRIYKYHLGLDLETFPYQPDGRAHLKILAVGALEKYKGFDYLLRAGRHLSDRGVNYEIELIGDGPEENFLKRLADELNIREKVRFLGWLPFHDVRTAMSQATILVHPSNGVADAVPTVIKEAMALGLPVIASNIAGIPELLDEGRCGILVPPRDPKELANAIERLLTHEALRLRYADAARQYADEIFDLWRNGRRLADLLRSTTRVSGKGRLPIRI
jgi:glycosyltransferase involved in cell wall biosynthesis